MTDTRSESLIEQHRPSYWAALIVSLAVLALYIVTLAPTTGMWDAGEYMASVKDYGLPHPPGNPLFMIVGHFVGLLPLSESYAVRINLLAATASATAAGFWFLIAERVLSSWFPERWMRITGGVLASLIGATAFTVWNQSVVNEKVYTVSLAFFAIVAWMMVRWADDPDAPISDRILLVVAYLLGVGYANHPAGFLTAPAVVAVVAFRRPWKFVQADALPTGKIILYSLVSLIGLTVITVIWGWLPLVGVLIVAGIAWARAQNMRRFPLVFAVVGMLGLGLTPFAYLPVRAAWFPKMNSGEPTACATHISANCTFSKVTLERTLDHIHRAQYGVKEGRSAPYMDQVGMWWHYFRWQWLRDHSNTHQAAQNALAVMFLGLGLIGGYVHWRRDRRSFLFFGPLVFTMTLALIYYLNFKFGATQSPELGNTVEREVRDRDYFYIWSFSAWGVWAALGLSFIWQTVASWLSGKSEMFPSRRNMLIASPLLAIGFIPLFGNYTEASRAGETFTRDWASDLLQSVEPYGILITNGDNDTYPLWYAQQVEGIRKDVVVIVTTYLNMNWAVRQLVRNPIEPYDSAQGAEIYQSRPWVKPTTPPVNMTFEQIDAIQPYVQLPQAQVFQHGDIRTTIPAGVFMQDQMMVLYMIRDSYPERGIFFSSPVTGIGLDDYLVKSGLGYKLMPGPITETDSIKRVHDEFVNVPELYSLWTSEFKGIESLIHQKRWLDQPSIGIPLRYAATGMTLADALRLQGRTEEAQKVQSQVLQIAETIDMLQYFQR